MDDISTKPMRSPKFQYHPSYVDDMQFIMHEAHRRASQLIRPPALAWHLAYRRQPAKLDQLETGVGSERKIFYPNVTATDTNIEDWYENIERFVLTLLHQCVQNAHEVTEFVINEVGISTITGNPAYIKSKIASAEIALFRHHYDYEPGKAKANFRHSKPVNATNSPSKYDTVILGGTWRPPEVDGGFAEYAIRVEVFEDYFCVSCTLHLPKPLDGKAQPCWLTGVLAPLTKTIDAAQEKILAGEPVDPKIAHLSTVIEDAYKGIWDLFADDFLEPVLRGGVDVMVESRHGGSPRKFFHEMLAESCFANFRGLILSASKSPNSPVSNHFKRIAGNVQEAEAIQLIDALQPILKRTESLWFKADEPPKLPKAPFESADYTFSTFCHKRYLYGSYFGAPVSPKDDKRHAPVSYVVLAFNDEWRQIGRTILRLHTMGTLRLAALFELRKLRDVDETLVRMEQELQLFHLVSKEDDGSLDAFVNGSIKSIVDLAQGNVSASSVVVPNYFSKITARYPQSENRDIYNSAISIADTAKLVSAAYEKFKTGKPWERKAYEIELLNLRRLIRDMNYKLKILYKDESHILDIRLEGKRLIRIIDLLLESKDVDSFRRTLLDRVRTTLSRMDRGIREGGVTHIATRSKYCCDRFDSLAYAMHIETIPGYQRYDLFVKQRLDRSLAAIQAISDRFKQIADIERHLTQELSESIIVQRQVTIGKIQRMADVIAWFFLVPYYASHTAEVVVHHVQGLEWIPSLVAAFFLITGWAMTSGDRKELARAYATAPKSREDRIKIAGRNLAIAFVATSLICGVNWTGSWCIDLLGLLLPESGWQSGIPFFLVILFVVSAPQIAGFIVRRFASASGKSE